MKAKNPVLFFLSETKTSVSKMKGLQRKLELTQGILVLSDGQSGDLVMLWHEGVAVSLRSCLNSHIDVVVNGEVGVSSWRVAGCYGQPDARKRHISGSC